MILGADIAPLRVLKKKTSIQSAWHFPQLTPKYWSSKEPRDIGSESLSIHTHHSRNWQSYQIITFFTEWCCFGLTHWGLVTHICIGNLTIIGSDNGLSPGRRQAIIWTNVGILLIGPLGTNFSEMLSEIHTFPFKKMHLKMPSAKMATILSQPQCVNSLRPGGTYMNQSTGPTIAILTNHHILQKMMLFRLTHWDLATGKIMLVHGNAFCITDPLGGESTNHR